MKTVEYLEKLCGMHAPTGDEEEVAAFLSEHFRKHGFEVRRDNLGNVIARKGKGGKKVMFAAHMDEVSMVVSTVTKTGFLKFLKVGGIYDGVLGNARVLVHGKEKYPGVIGLKAPHLMKDEDMKKLQESDDLYIDIGAKDEAEVKKLGIKPGTNITYNSTFTRLRNGYLMSKSLDNRVGCSLLCSLAEELTPQGFELYLVGTVREETGLYGAGTSTFQIEPDLAIAVDVSLAGGSPDLPEEQVPVKMMGGPTLVMMEGAGRGMIMQRKLVEWVEELASRKKIALQFEVLDKGGTDASRMQYQKHGFLAMSVGVPSRYLHSQNEVIHESDLYSTINLLKLLATEFKNYRG